jgi:hypothetical protein
MRLDASDLESVEDLLFEYKTTYQRFCLETQHGDEDVL